MNNGEQERLQFLLRVIGKEITSLEYALSQVNASLTNAQLTNLDANPDLALKIEAFASRFARLQDTLGDKLLPSWLQQLGEPVGAAVDNLDKAERLGILVSVDEWLAMRQLRNQLVHEYIEDKAQLQQALQQAMEFVPQVIAFANAIKTDIAQRAWW